VRSDRTIADGQDINFLSAAMNIDPVVALRNYHEIRAAETLKALDAFNRRTLMVYPRTAYTDLNGLICKMFKAATSR
jgi:hypothetical protein